MILKIKSALIYINRSIGCTIDSYSSCQKRLVITIEKTMSFQNTKVHIFQIGGTVTNNYL